MALFGRGKQHETCPDFGTWRDGGYVLGSPCSYGARKITGYSDAEMRSVSGRRVLLSLRHAGRKWLQGMGEIRKHGDHWCGKVGHTTYVAS
jgi:ribosomal protein L34